MSAPANAQDPTPASTSAPTSKKATFSRTLQAAWDEAARTGRPVEVPSRFTETMKVWAQPDGKRLKAALYTRPVQLRNPDKGTWEPIDTRIVTRDGTLQAARVKTPLTFGQRGAKRLVAADGDRGTTAMHTTRPLPEPVISGDTVTYRDAVAPGADLVVQAQADGFISRVVFHRRPDGPVTVRLPLTVPKGTKFGKTRQGLPQLQDAKGKAVAAPIVLTAMDAKAETAPDQGKTSPVPAQVETSGDTPELVFTPDEKFLADPAVSYPVTISASSEWFGGGTPTDAWVSKNDPYSNNAAAGWLRAGTTSTSADIARVYLKFNTDAPELKGATVIDADLIIWNYKSGGPNGQLCGDPLGAGIVAQRITSDWDVRYLSWNNQPSRASETEGLNRAGYNYDASGTWCAKDEALWYRVTGMARAWIEQGVPNYGLVLRAASETAAINWRQYYSSEYSGQPYPGYRHPPTLMIEYEPAPSRTTGFLIPYKPNPTVGDAIDNTFVSPKLPEAPEMTEEDVLAARETPVDYVLEDSSLGLRPPDDMTLEEWLEDIGATHPLEPDPSPGPDPDTAPPTVIGTLPDGDQQDVPIDTQLRVSFDEPVSGAQITLRDQNGTEVAGTVTMDVDDTVAVFVPNHELSVSTGYTAEVTGAQDAAGNTMAPYTWSFTTAATAPSPSPSPSTSPTPVPGLVAAYGMDEAFGTTVADSSGHGNTGTARNTTRVTTGKYGRALSFNGFSSEVVVNHSASLRLTTGMTLSAWVNPSTVTDWRTVLMKELDEEFIPSYGLWASADGGPMGWILTEDEAGMPASDTSLPTNTWTHLALTYNGSKAILYVNGVPVVQESVSGSIWDEGGDLRIGANITWGEYFAGLIDEVRIYNRALSAAEIQADMNTPIGPAPPTTAALATTAGPTVAKTVLSSADRLTVLVSGTEGRPASVEVEIAQQPKKSSRSKRLLWSGRTAATEKAEHTLKIPAGKVRTGETVRWRARVHVDGKPGAWSSWQETVISEPEPVSTAKDATVQAAARKFPYNHITHQECLDEVGKLERPAWEMSWSNRRWRAFKAKNSFSLCFAMWIGERDEDDEHNRFTPLFSAARWYGRLTMLFHTYVGRANGNTAARDGDPGMNSRQIKVQVKLHDFTVVGDPDEWGNRPLRIGVGQKGRSCTLSYIQNGVKVNAPYGRDAPARQWVNGLDFILDVPWDGLPHPDQVSICTVQPFVKFLGNPELDDGYWLLDPYFRDKSKITTFICDSATWIRAYTGGCVVGSIAPVFILDGNDSKVRESVRHWWAALYHADQTRPDRPYPKRIPGAWNSTNPGCRRTSSGPGGCLHRTRDPDRQMANRDDHAIPACRKIKPGYRHPDSCDEFPFATTLEGAASTTNDFSVRIIPHRDNCSSGSRTGAFYLRNRIRDHSPFWVDVILPGESRPVSGAEGVVVSDPFPEEIVNFNLCTFDGIS